MYGVDSQNDTNPSPVSMEKICLALYELKEDISKIKKTLLHMVLIKVKRPVDLSFLRTETEVCYAVIALHSKVNSLTSGNREVRYSEFVDSVGSILANSTIIFPLVTLISVVSC